MSTLYHYTNAAGLKGIIEERAFWASEYRFLNDPSEFQTGWDMISDAVDARKYDIIDVSSDAYEFVAQLYRNPVATRNYGFVASLSTVGDLLSQWRGYNGGKGFALGISYDWLLANASAQGFSLFPVVYDEKEQLKLCEKAVNLLIDMLKEAGNDSLKNMDAVRSWWRHALMAAFAFKNRHFAAEHEYRLAYVSDVWPSTTKTRSGLQGLIPYLPCRFGDVKIHRSLVHPNNCGIERIVIGPAAKENQKIAVDALLSTQTMRLTIDWSDIPYVAD